MPKLSRAPLLSPASIDRTTMALQNYRSLLEDTRGCYLRPMPPLSILLELSVYRLQHLNIMIHRDRCDGSVRVQCQPSVECAKETYLLDKIQ